MRALVLGVLGSLLVATPALAQSAPRPCVEGTPACARWIDFADVPARSMVYASYPLDDRNATVTRALVMVHGASRNADSYFETAMAAAFLAGALENTVVIAPHFVAGSDSAPPNVVRWAEGRQSWRAGGASPSHASLTSFDFLDAIVRRLANKEVFPNLTQIVVAGHSAGGQVATRYAMTSRVHDTPGISVSYVVANPSSYAWPTALRPLPVGSANPDSAGFEMLGPNGTRVNSDFTFGPFDATKAPQYNQWPSGLESLQGYAEGMDPDRLRRQLADRPTTYLFGQLDVLPLNSFDSSPNGMAQGPSRRARGQAFFKYVTDSLQARHQAMIIGGCGHSARCIYTHDRVLPVIFP